MKSISALIIGIIIVSASSAAAECHIKYGITGYMKPYEWINEQGKPEGLTIELLDMLSKEAGCTYEVIQYDSEELTELLESKKINMMWYSRLLEYQDPDTEFMAPAVKLTVSYRRFLSRKDSPHIEKMEDIRGKTILVMKGMISEIFAESIKDLYGLTIIRYDSVEEAVSDLSNGKGDFSFFSTNVLSGVLKDGKYNNLRVSGEPIMPAMFELVVNKKDTELAAILEKALQNLRMNGSYDALLKKWLKTEPDYSRIYKIAGISAVSAAFLFLVILLWNMSLRVQVAKKTEILKKNSAENVKLREEAMIYSRMAALGEMATSVAHEINNPTGLIMHNVNFLEKFTKELSSLADNYMDNDDKICSMKWENAKQEALVSEKVIKESLKRIAGTVNELKEYGKVEKDGYEKINLKKCLESSMRLTSYFTKKYTENFKIEIPEEDIFIYGNPMQVEETIINLIQNSCYALKDKSGYIKCSVAFSKETKMATVCVEDNGCGMSRSTMEKACEAFFTTRGKNGGTGLGLSITARIVKEHNGRMEIKSDENKGTSVTLFFPGEIAEESNG